MGRSKMRASLVSSCVIEVSQKHDAASDSSAQGMGAHLELSSPPTCSVETGRRA